MCSTEHRQLVKCKCNRIEAPTLRGILIGWKVIKSAKRHAFVSRTFTVLPVSFITGLADAFVRPERVLADRVNAAVVRDLLTLVHIWKESTHEIQN